MGAPPAGTKIVATVGPATASAETLEQILQAGTDVLRLNFSHGRREEHERALQTIRAASERLDRPVAIMGDLCGPKIRLLELENGELPIDVGQQLRIVREPVLGNAERIATNTPEIIDDVEVGHRLLIDDGTIRLRATARDRDGLLCHCEVGGVLRNRKGLNLPDTDLHQPSLTDKDIDDAAWAVEAGLEYLALSFVRRAEDVKALRQRLSAADADCHIVSKIETPQAIANLDAIIEASDCVLVARGDLGVEVDVATVPRLQKEIIDRCRRTGKPVIVATQMLQSMVDSPTPTRAEVSDVANAIYDGADAVMLSAETAVGKYPVRAVETLEHVAKETESYDPARSRPVEVCAGRLGVAVAVARSACAVADDTDAKAVVLWTETGTMARLVSKHRLDRPVIALTPSAAVQRRMALYYGITPLKTDRPEHANALIAQADRAVSEGQRASPGDLIIIAFGPKSLTPTETGSIIIHTVEDD